MEDGKAWKDGCWCSEEMAGLGRKSVCVAGVRMAVCVGGGVRLCLCVFLCGGVCTTWFHIFPKR